MKPKTLILMVVAVTCGLGASYMTSRLLAERGNEPEDKVKVLVAKKALPQGMPVTNLDEMFQFKEIAKESAPKEALVNPEEIKGRVLRRSLRQDDHVTAGDLLSKEEAGLGGHMSEGYRAFGIRVNAEMSASGFAALPLSRVDLIWTMRRGNDKDSSTQVLLENVLVLAADVNTNRTEGNGAMLANVVTVALKPEDALKVAMARELGTISLVLRKFNDNRKADYPKLTVEELLTGHSKRDSEEGGSYTDDTQQPKIAQIDIPALPTNTKPVEVAKADVVKAEAPKGTLHRMRLIEGDKERVVEYWLNDKGEVVHNDVVRSEIPPAPPRPTQAQPEPQAQPESQVAPAPTAAPGRPGV